MRKIKTACWRALVASGGLKPHSVSVLKKFDRLKKKFGEVSPYEIIQILVEKELMQPEAMQRSREISPRVSRSIPKSVKVEVYTGKCANCGKKHGLEYDHRVKFSHGGTNGADNIQMLCRSCNMRKEIVARQVGVFVWAGKSFFGGMLGEQYLVGIFVMEWGGFIWSALTGDELWKL
jgi:hypothetical protein